MSDHEREHMEAPRFTWAWPAAAAWLVVWVAVCVVAPVEGATPQRLLLLPGVAALVAALWILARAQLRPVEDRWVPPPPPQKEQPPAEEHAEADAKSADGPADYDPEPDPTGPVVPSISLGAGVVHHGERADPAFPLWQLAWDLPGGGKGTIVLPNGPEITLGRSEDSDVVVALTEVSRAHVSFSVTQGTVEVLELESRNGTWLNKGNEDGTWERLAQKQRVPLKAYDSLRLADPWVIELTLVPLGR